MKHLLTLALGVFLGSIGLASAAWVSSLSGPQDVSQTWGLLAQQITNYISFAESGEVGEFALSPSVQVSGTSILTIMPNGALRYIQTSATP